MRKILAAVALLCLTACSDRIDLVHTSAPTATAVPARQVDSKSCPAVSDRKGYVAADYVDFIQAFGHQYLADFGGHATVKRSDLVAVVLRSRCSFRALNDRTHEDPGMPRDGDTGFLPPGTPIYAVQGWSKECRLAAEHDGRIAVYLAMQEHAKYATPRPCAQSH